MKGAVLWRGSSETWQLSSSLYRRRKMSFLSEEGHSASTYRYERLLLPWLTVHWPTKLLVFQQKPTYSTPIDVGSRQWVCIGNNYRNHLCTVSSAQSCTPRPPWCTHAHLADWLLCICHTHNRHCILKWSRVLYMPNWFPVYTYHVIVIGCSAGTDCKWH